MSHVIVLDFGPGLDFGALFPADDSEDHAVDGGNLSWGFAIPEATVTHTVASPPLTLPVIANQSGFVGVAVDLLLPEATGGTPTYTYTATPLPGGLSFDGSTRRITGTPTTVESATTTYRVDDLLGQAFSRDFAFAITSALLLSDFDDTGLAPDAAALLVASAPGTTGNNPYADSDRGGTDTPTDGELGLSTTDTVISRIRRFSATALNLNDNDSPSALDIGTYFAAGGDGNDLTLYLQTSDGLASFAVAGQIIVSGGNFVRFTLPADAQALLDNLDTGDRWIFAFARPASVTTDHTVDGGDLAWGFAIPEATVTHTTPGTTDHAVDGGNLSWGFAIPEASVTHTPASSGDTVSVTVPLTGISVFDDYIRWSDDQSLGSTFAANGAEQTLSLVDLNNANPPGRVRISIVGLGNDFTPEFEANGTITFEASDGEILAVQIADADMAEIYQWTPTNSAEVVAFVLHVKGLVDQSGTITLTGVGTAVTTDHAVNGGNLSWGFTIPQAAVTIVRAAGTTDHAVNGGDLAWGFAIPQATITIVRAVAVDHAVDGGNLQWGFNIPQATVTIVRAVATDHMVDGGNLSWGFNIPRGRVTHTTLRGTFPRAYRIRVDWDGDETFGNAHADVTSRLVRMPTAKRGRNYASQIYGRSEAGYFEAVLQNYDGLYDRFNAGSDLVGLVVPGILVEYAVRRSGQSGYRVQWTGLLDDVRPIEGQGGHNDVKLTALGALSLLTQTDVSAPVYADILTRDALPHILDQADVPAARRGTIAGDREMAIWWSPTQLAIGAIREIEETELGFVFEEKTGAQISMDAENHRQAGGARVSEFTLTLDGNPGPGEVGALPGPRITDPIQDIANVITVPVRSFSVGAEAVLWTCPQTPIELSAGASIVLLATYPTPGASRNHAGVSEWTDLAAGTDYRAFANANGTGANRTSALTVTETKAGNTLRIEIENTHSGVVYLTAPLQARGTPLIEEATTPIVIDDQGSIRLYRKRDYLVPSQFISTVRDAQSYGSFLISLLAEPQTRALVFFEGSTYEEYADDIDLRDRVTLRRHGIAEEMFVEAMELGLGQGGQNPIGLLLSPAAPFADVIVLDVGPGLDTGVLSR